MNYDHHDAPSAGIIQLIEKNEVGCQITKKFDDRDHLSWVKVEFVLTGDKAEEVADYVKWPPRKYPTHCAIKK